MVSVAKPRPALAQRPGRLTSPSEGMSLFPLRQGRASAPPLLPVSSRPVRTTEAP
jgi:hypothetical protein